MGSLAALRVYSKFILKKYFKHQTKFEGFIPLSSLYSATLVADILKCLSICTYIRTYLVWQSNGNCKNHIYIFCLT